MLRLDDDLLRTLPLPIAQLYQRAHHAKTPLDRHLAAYFLWEASLKLLASVAIVEYARLGESEPQHEDQLTSLARPSVGHWWGFVRLLLPILAARKDPGFSRTDELLLGRPRDDFPRAAALDGALQDALPGGEVRRGQATVQLSQLFDRLVQYRNREIGHGVPGARSRDYYERMSHVLLAGVTEMLRRIDLLAGRQLFHVPDVRRTPSGTWLIERFELAGEHGRWMEPVELYESHTSRLPHPQRLYLQRPSAADEDRILIGDWDLLHPLAAYDGESNEVLFLNGRRGKSKAEYLGYNSGNDRREVVASEHRELLARLLGVSVDEQALAAWAAGSLHDEHHVADDAELAQPASDDRRRMGEFDLLTRIGRGGMGTVYRAIQPSLGRQVAVKRLLHPGDERSLARFSREIRSLGRVDHPHLVKIFASGTDGEDYFYAMELIEGADLSSVCTCLAGTSASEIGERQWQAAVSTACGAARTNEQPLSTADVAPAAAPATFVEIDAAAASKGYIAHAVAVVRQIAEAAHVLHEAGIVHRDIKPANVMVTLDGRAVLTDLGLARLADETEGRVTRTRQFVGTLRYASPEQVLAAAPVDCRSDVYSLGATLWELLTLSPLFGATDQTPAPELMRRIQRTDPDRPSRQNPRVPRDLEAIVMKCLEKDESRRYRTAAALAEDLARWEHGEPVLAQPQTVAYVLGKYLRRYRYPIAGAGGMAVLVLAATVFAFYQIAAARNAAIRLAGENGRLARQAVEARDLESQMRRLAEDREQAQRRLAYVGRMNSAQRALRRGDMAHMLALLDATDSNVLEALQHWEWDYLVGLGRDERLSLQGHTRSVWRVAFSPDGRRVASASLDGTVRVWNALTGDELQVFSEHAAKAYGIDWSPDGTQIVSSDGDGVVVLWTPGGPQQPRHLRGHPHFAVSVAFSPDGRRVVGAGGEVYIWDAETCGHVLTLEDEQNASAVDFSPDGAHLATASYDGSVKLWNATDGKLVRQFDGHSSQVGSVAFAPDGGSIATASHDGTVRVWSVADGSQLQRFDGHNDWVWGVAFSPDARYVASSSDDATVKIWDTATGEAVKSLHGHELGIASVVYSPDGTRVASASDDKTVKIWDAIHPRPVKVHQAQRAALSPVEDLLVTDAVEGPAAYVGIRGQHVLKLWQASTGRLTRTLHVDGPVGAIGFSGDGRLLAATIFPEEVDEPSTRIAFWTSPDWQPRGTVTHAGHVSAMALDPAGKQLVAADADGAILMWDTVSGAIHTQLDSLSVAPTSVAFSPDGRYLAAASGNSTDNEPGEILVWDARRWALMHRLPGVESLARQLAFSPDGCMLAAAIERTGPDTLGKEPGFVMLLDVQSGRELRRLRSHGRMVNSVAWSSDGQRLLSGSNDRSAILWDTSTWESVLTLDDHPRWVVRVAFGDHAKCLMSVDSDGTAHLRVADRAADVDHPRQSLPSSDEIARWHEREAEAAESAERWFTAAFHLHHLIVGRPQDVGLAARRGRALAAQADWSRAYADYSRALEQHPEDGPLRLRRSQVCAELGLDADAEADFAEAVRLSRACDLDPALPWTFRFGDVDTDQVELSHWETALVDFYNQSTGGSRRQWRGAGLACAALAVWESRNEPERSDVFWSAAASMFSSAVEETPADRAARRGLARCQAEIGDWNAVQQSCTAILESSPDASALYLRGISRFELGEYAASYEDLTAAIELGLEGGGIRAICGAVCESLEHWPQALDAYSTALEHLPDDVELHSRRARVCFRLGQLAEAAADIGFTALRTPPSSAARNSITPRRSVFLP